MLETDVPTIPGIHDMHGHILPQGEQGSYGEIGAGVIISWGTLVM